jgi:hypothetical protein
VLEEKALEDRGMAKNNFATCKVNAYKTESNFEKGTYIESA